MKLINTIILILAVLIIPTLAFGEAVVEIPEIYELPDEYYPNLTAITWQGGEKKFGKWRNFFNGFEMGWGISYNTRWNYKDNTWEPRDSIDSRAGICAMLRFNVAEGNVGGNVYEINFAPGSDENLPPDWNAAASYFFYDGNSETKAPATFMIKGAGNMDAVIKLAPNEGASPSRVNIRNACDGKLYIEREEIGSMFYSPFYTSITFPLMVFDNGFVAVGHAHPESAVDILGSITLRSANRLPGPPEPPNMPVVRGTSMNMKVDGDTGNITLTSIHDGETREIVVHFSNMTIVNP